MDGVWFCNSLIYLWYDRSYYACEYACLNMYLYIYLLICTCLHSLYFLMYLPGLWPQFRESQKSHGDSGQAWARSFGRPIQVARYHRWHLLGRMGKVVHVHCRCLSLVYWLNFESIYIVYKLFIFFYQKSTTMFLVGAVWEWNPSFLLLIVLFEQVARQ